MKEDDVESFNGIGYVQNSLMKVDDIESFNAIGYMQSSPHFIMTASSVIHQTITISTSLIKHKSRRWATPRGHPLSA